MSTNELKELVELYIDCELDKSKEPLMFSSLSENNEAREYFFNLNFIKSAVKNDLEPFPPLLEERLFNSLKEKETKPAVHLSSNRLFGYLSAFAATMFIIISIFLFNEVRGYKDKINSLSEQMLLQNRTINLILNNSLPPAEVKSKTINEVIVRANL